jgi:pyruvate,orthophosphate dikinase
MEDVAQGLGTDVETIRRRAAELAEANPMLGLRGCRLGIEYPEIYEMQVRAIFEGALAMAKDTGKEPPHPEVMIPLIATRREMEITRAQVDKVAAQVFAETGQTIEYSVGTMIELPRATLVADKIAELADFFSFGTNDLTQTVYGLSRDDAGKFLPKYLEAGIFPKDQFVSIDPVGICGEHGGDPASIALCEKLGLDYVSCSPYRVPVARLAAAQAALGVESDRTA